MAINAAGIIFSGLNNSNFSRLTQERTVAAIPFACRYRLIDFCLSNLVNANISNINVLANYNYRSLVEHIGSGKDWDLARRNGGINIISPYQTGNFAAPRAFLTHLEALKSIKEYAGEIKEKYVVLMDPDNVLNINIEEIINQHKNNGADITIVTKAIDESYKAKTCRIMVASNGIDVVDIVKKDTFSATTPEVSLNIFVMRTTFLLKLIDQASAYGWNSLTEYLISAIGKVKICTYRYDGYVAAIGGFNDYYKCSMELLEDKEALRSLLWQKNTPIYTRVHNSSPTHYRNSAEVENSMIADDCIIEGKVVNSILFRGVVVKRDVLVENSIVFQGGIISEGAKLHCIVADKNVIIGERVVLSGSETVPFYIPRGQRV